MMPAKLYCFGESGNSYKAALTMTLSGYSWKPVWVDFFHGETRSASFRELNSMGEAPVLIEGDRVLTQSCLIQLHVTEQTGLFAGDTDDDRKEVLRWLFWTLAGGLANLARCGS